MASYKSMLWFTKRFINPLTRRLARSRWGPFAILYHVGRRSGKPYATPIIVVPTTQGFVLALTYGPDVDWYRNVLAAGQCKILWHRHEYFIQQIEPMDAKTALPMFFRLGRPILRRRNAQFVQMR